MSHAEKLWSAVVSTALGAQQGDAGEERSSSEGGRQKALARAGSAAGRARLLRSPAARLRGGRAGRRIAGCGLRVGRAGLRGREHIRRRRRGARGRRRRRLSAAGCLRPAQIRLLPSLHAAIGRCAWCSAGTRATLRNTACSALCDIIGAGTSSQPCLCRHRSALHVQGGLKAPPSVVAHAWARITWRDMPSSYAYNKAVACTKSQGRCCRQLCCRRRRQGGRSWIHTGSSGRDRPSSQDHLPGGGARRRPRRPRCARAARLPSWRTPRGRPRSAARAPRPPACPGAQAHRCRPC